jgi:glycerol-3-phosphate dehydrogenase
MAKTNVRGSILWEQLAMTLGLEYIKTGSLVVARNEQESVTIQQLYRNGIENGVAELEILSAEQTHQLEPNLRQDIFCSLYAKNAAIINPYQSCIALSEYAARNGVNFMFSSMVTDISVIEGGYYVTAGNNLFKTKYIVNAAGIGAEDISYMAGGEGFGSYSVKGEYYLIDRKHGGYTKKVVFPVPSTSGKGVVVAPTVHGNLLIGPTSDRVSDRDNTAVTAEGLETIRAQASLLFNNLPFYDNIRNFAGNRAYISSDDFHLAISSTLPGFINLAGIKSPGLSSAPALAEEVFTLLFTDETAPKRKTEMVPYRYPQRFKEMSEEEQQEALKRQPRYGQVICRCETVTEGDILQALSETLTPLTISAIKRRVNAGMGRCQGGFCSVKVHELIARHMGVPYESVTMDGTNSFIVFGDTKKGARG